jgi:hypothetical protein
MSIKTVIVCDVCKEEFPYSIPLDNKLSTSFTRHLCFECKRQENSTSTIDIGRNYHA